MSRGPSANRRDSRPTSDSTVMPDGAGHAGDPPRGHRRLDRRRGTTGTVGRVGRLLCRVRRRARQRGRGQLPQRPGGGGPAIRRDARVRRREGGVRRDQASALVRALIARYRARITPFPHARIAPAIPGFAPLTDGGLAQDPIGFQAGDLLPVNDREPAGSATTCLLRTTSKCTDRPRTTTIVAHTAPSATSRPSLVSPS